MLGEHTYYAEVWQDDGNYSRTDIITGVMDSQTMRIAAFAGGEWMALRLTNRSDSDQTFQWSRTAAQLHVRGAAFPVLEMSPFEDESGSYTCAFADPKEAKAFEQFKGKTVILKSRRENVVVGAVTQITKKEADFYTVFSFSLQRIQWEDFVRYDSTA